MTVQNGSQDLLNYIISQANSDSKNWFGFKQQRIAGINMAYEIAKYHADKLSPEEIVDYVNRLNNAIFHKLIKAVE
jgi:hypothetical protein